MLSLRPIRKISPSARINERATKLKGTAMKKYVVSGITSIVMTALSIALIALSVQPIMRSAEAATANSQAPSN